MDITGTPEINILGLGPLGDPLDPFNPVIVNEAEIELHSTDEAEDELLFKNEGSIALVLE